MPNISRRQGNAHPNHAAKAPLTHRDGYDQKNARASVSKALEKLASCAIGGTQNGAATTEKNLASPQKVKHRVVYTQHVLGTCSKESKAGT